MKTRDGWSCFADVKSAPAAWSLKDSNRLATTHPLPEGAQSANMFPWMFLESGPGLYIYAGVGRFQHVRRGKRGFEAELTIDPGLPLDVAREIRGNRGDAAPKKPSWLSTVPKDALDALIGFATWWYGDEESAPADTKDPAEIVKWFHEAGLARAVQNRFVEKAAAENGRTPFYVENQGVCTWAYDREGRVFVRWNHQREWKEEASRLETFLLQASIFEAVVGAPESRTGSAVSATETARLIRRMKEVPAPPWSWPEGPHRFYASPGALASVAPNGPDFTVQVGATAETTLEALLDDIDADWA